MLIPRPTCLATTAEYPPLARYCAVFMSQASSRDNRGNMAIMMIRRQITFYTHINHDATATTRRGTEDATQLSRLKCAGKSFDRCMVLHILVIFNYSKEQKSRTRSVLPSRSEMIDAMLSDSCPSESI